MTGRTRRYWTAAALLWLSGCNALTPNTPSLDLNSPASNSELRLVSYNPETEAKAAAWSRQGLVIVLDGAGGFEAASRTMRKTAAECKMPLEVHGFHWTHGYCRIFSDQMHASHTRREGQKLAELLLTCRQEAPDQPIYLVGHSAGCGVALIAAEKLPPNTLERIVLLAPAVSAKHDLRAALRSSCRGIDVFISNHDWCCLGLGVMLAGTTDRYWLSGAAGKIGFQPILTCPEDEALYAKLRQYPWNPSLMWTGHKGGHYGAYQPGFLRAFVFPLLWP
jgi:pimeloyl-ACP methyl ester carboxylesterase